MIIEYYPLEVQGWPGTHAALQRALGQPVLPQAASGTTLFPTPTTCLAILLDLNEKAKIIVRCLEGA